MRTSMLQPGTLTRIRSTPTGGRPLPWLVAEAQRGDAAVVRSCRLTAVRRTDGNATLRSRHYAHREVAMRALPHDLGNDNHGSPRESASIPDLH